MDQINLSRLKSCMQRAQKGEQLTIGFLGGSITQGSLATEHKKCYAYRVFEWWKDTFPKTEFFYVNGGIGGTDSYFGVSRAVTDVLMYQPDVLVVDFCVNDKANEFYQETYEGVIRKALAWFSRPAVILLNNVFYDTGENAQEYHNALGDWYHVPHISIKDTLYQKIQEGVLIREEITPDGLHPNDKGHELVAREITSFLEQIKEHLNENEREADTPLPAPMTANAYENARRLTICNSSPKLSGFHADTEEKTGHLDFYKNGWIAKKAGDKIRFEVEASCIAVQYRKTIRRPARRAKLVLDGDIAHARILDGNFEENWGDCLYLEPVLHHGAHKKHTLEIEVTEDGIKEATPFYLLSIIIA